MHIMYTYTLCGFIHLCRNPVFTQLSSPVTGAVESCELGRIYVNTSTCTSDSKPEDDQCVNEKRRERVFVSVWFHVAFGFRSSILSLCPCRGGEERGQRHGEIHRGEQAHGERAEGALVYSQRRLLVRDIDRETRRGTRGVTSERQVPQRRGHRRLDV